MSYMTLNPVPKEIAEGPAGLVLTGGGARAAYQVGVLYQIAKWLWDEGATHFLQPFSILSGTSAGAINAAGLACAGSNFFESVEAMVDTWENFTASQVYDVKSLGGVKGNAKWMTALSLGLMLRKKPKSLLDNSPLADLLNNFLHLRRLDEALESGALRALAVSASSYSSGHHVTFFQAHEQIEPWVRTQRVAKQDRITVSHLLASAAIPFIFPSIPLQYDDRIEFFGDGSMRQLAPISPAIHLGATRVLIIGAAQLERSTMFGGQLPSNTYPTMAQIAGHAMASIFLDSLAVDIERLMRVNKTLALLPQDIAEKTPLKPVRLLVIAPSQRIDEIAAKHVRILPKAVQHMLISNGNSEARSAALASYLLFEAPYTRELIRLGIADTIAQKREVFEFFNLT
ncbi:MAG: patatin-like phospholipase family protein [Burkholderiales bacterium]|nr:patatin-like phospholipase family protein [Burkholderiales bacterium]